MNRLTHLGFIANIVGDQTAGPFTGKNCLITISHTGERASTISFAHQAKQLGGRIIAITSNVNYSLARLADSAIELAPEMKSTRFQLISVRGFLLVCFLRSTLLHS